MSTSNDPNASDRGTSGAGAARSARRATKVAAHLLSAVALSAVAVAGLTQGGLAPLPAYAQAVTAEQARPEQVRPATAQALPSFAEIVERVKPAVVSVRVRADAAAAAAGDRLGALPGGGEFNLPDDHPFQEFYRRFRGENDAGPRGARPGAPGQPGTARPGMSQGSGFFISADGYLVTNNHVIEKGSKVEVLMDDGRSLEAKVVGTDPKTDLALLKVAEGGPFPFVEMAQGAARVGDWVLAVGNPFGLGGTVTAGIVSARARDIGAGPYDDFLQIDASVNRGNSGGPAFDLQGRVVGVNTAIASPSGGNVGIAFAIPAETVQKIVAQLKETGTVSRGYLGVQIQPVTKDIAASVGLDKPEGAIVARVEPGSPAAAAGIRQGDVVLSVDGKPVRDARDLSRRIAWLEPSATVELQILRDGGKQTVAVKLGRQPGEETAAAERQEKGGEMGMLGLQLAPAASVGGTAGKGVAVVGVEPGSVAGEKGFKTGDVIAEVAGRPVETPADVRKAVEESRKEGKKAVLFRVEAKEGARFIALQLAAA